MCKAGRHGVTAKQLSYLSMGMDVVLQCFTSATHVHAADEAFMTNFPWVLDTMLFFMAWRTGWGHAITHLAVFVFACSVLVPNVFSHLSFVSLDVFATDPDSAFVNVLSLSVLFVFLCLLFFIPFLCLCFCPRSILEACAWAAGVVLRRACAGAGHTMQRVALVIIVI